MCPYTRPHALPIPTPPRSQTCLTVDSGNAWKDSHLCECRAHEGRSRRPHAPCLNALLTGALTHSSSLPGLPLEQHEPCGVGRTADLIPQASEETGAQNSERAAWLIKGPRFIFYCLLGQGSLYLSPTHPHSFRPHPDHQVSGPWCGDREEARPSCCPGHPRPAAATPKVLHPRAPSLWPSAVWSYGLRYASPQPPRPEVSRAGLTLFWRVSRGNPLSAQRDDVPQLVPEASPRL